MSKTIYFKQCSLELVTKDDKMTTTSWLPEKFAIKDKYVQLKNRETGEWVNGWRITLVRTKRKTEEEVIESSKDHENMKKRTDV